MNPLDNRAQILLLIGRDLMEAHHVIDHRIGPKGSPYAQRLKLGWVVVGETCLGKVHKPEFVNVNKINLLVDGRSSIFTPCVNKFEVRTSTVEIGKTVFERTSCDDKIGMSVEDREFLDIMDKEMYKGVEGNWVAPLPFRSPRPKLPNNRTQATNRAKTLHRSLQKDSVKKQHFVDFMDKVIRNNHAEIAPPLQDDEECWYLPIFGVYHSKKPDQIRVVFDSSAQHNGVSLNNVLLQGPDMINNLLGVLLRFRRESIAMTADIQQMFYSFHVREDHRNFLRFLWYRDNDPDKDLIEYRMRVHVFGNSPSPAVATYALRKSVGLGQVPLEVKQFVERDFYVDDGLTSVSTPEEAVALMKCTQETLMTNGNLRLHKIASNSDKVMNAFPVDDLAKDLKNLDFSVDSLPQQRSLGLIWDLETDTFAFKVCTEGKPFTKRGILSTINSLFDPIGFVAPVVIQGKILLRQLISNKCDWDDELPIKDRHEWISWRDSLKLLEDLRIPRTYVPVSLEAVENKEVHIFCDASEEAIAAAAYLKTSDQEGNNNIGFLLGKAKVAPKSGHTGYHSERNLRFGPIRTIFILEEIGRNYSTSETICASLS